MELLLGLDIDGTITANPPYFAKLAAQVRMDGGTVHVVTSRSQLAARETMDELRTYRLQFDQIHFLPPMSEAVQNCPHSILDWYGKYLYGKVAYAVKNSLTHFVDDDEKVRRLFNHFVPQICFLYPDEMGGGRIEEELALQRGQNVGKP